MTSLQEIKSWPQWVGYKLVPKENGKMDKKPRDPYTGYNASSINPKTWSDAKTAWTAKHRYGWDGIGFVFTIESGIVGVDLDDCFHYPEQDETKRLKPWARDIVQCLNSYTELSPSENGLHVLCRGTIPHSITKNKIGFEMYNEARYFTVTGREFGSTAIGICHDIEARNTELQALHAVYADEPQTNLPTVNNQYNQKQLDKSEVIKALDTIPIHQDYLDWLRCLMAIHDAYPNSEGVQIVEAWSPGKRGEVANKFRSFDRTSKSGVTIGTLFHIAKQHGYSPPPPIKSKANGRKTHIDKVSRLMAV